MRAREWAERLAAVARGVEEGDEAQVVAAVEGLSRRHRLLAPLALLVGGVAMLFGGLRILLANWRLTVIQIPPAMWIWAAMYDLRGHVLHDRTWHAIRGPIVIPIVLAVIAITALCFWLNALFGFAISQDGRPEVRPAVAEARPHLTTILGSGALVGLALGLTVTVVTRAHSPWFALALSVVIGVMMIAYVAVPARLIGVEKNSSRRDRLSASVVGSVLGAVVSAPAYVTRPGRPADDRLALPAPPRRRPLRRRLHPPGGRDQRGEGGEDGGEAETAGGAGAAARRRRRGTATRRDYLRGNRPAARAGYAAAGDPDPDRDPAEDRRRPAAARMAPAPPPQPDGAGARGGRLGPPHQLPRDRPLQPEPRAWSSASPSNLEVPLRDRNELLIAAGFAPEYRELAYEDPDLEPVRAAIDQVLAAQDPYPALVVDRHWELVTANRGLGLITAGVAPHLLEPPANAMRIAPPSGRAGAADPQLRRMARPHPRAARARQSRLTGDAAIAELVAELAAYPAARVRRSAPTPTTSSCRSPARPDGDELRFFSTVATFGTAVDVTVAELAIESFFPADDITAAACRAYAPR